MKDSFQLKTVIGATLLAASLFTAQSTIAQGTRSDYERALNLRKTTANKVFRQRVNPQWLPGNTRFWYRNDLANEESEFILVNAETGTRQRAFDHGRLAAALSKATGKEIRADKLPIDKLKFSESGTELELTSHGRRWKCDLGSYEVREELEEEQISPSLQAHAEIRPSTRTGDETSITFINATEDDVEVYWVDFERERRHYATIGVGKQHEQHTYAGHVWLATDKDRKTLAVFVATEEAGNAVIDANSVRKAVIKRKPREVKQRGKSPNGKWDAFIKDYNLYVRNFESGEEIALSSDGTEEDAYSRRFYWSPDSEKLVSLRVKKGDDRKI